jgi:hypothetical protein
MMQLLLHYVKIKEKRKKSRMKERKKERKKATKKERIIDRLIALLCLFLISIKYSQRIPVECLSLLFVITYVTIRSIDFLMT